MPNGKIKLVIKGPIPAFKTQKRGTIAQTAEGKIYGRTVTRRQDRARMKEIIRAMLSQLLSASGQEVPILTASTRRLLTAWLGPFASFDDSAKWIARFTVETELVGMGQDEAIIEIDEL